MDAYLADYSVCENPACGCPVVESGTFCSDHCRNSNSEAGMMVCECGHSSCSAGEPVFQSGLAANGVN